uniref:Angiotensin-converting enzyme n=1 Tax=Macrostomum lignano TaxID=282301 RepID=A0A1I8I4W8_9PLAT
MTRRSLLLSCLLLAAVSLAGSKSTNVTEATLWFEQFSGEHRILLNKVVEASWASNTDINQENKMAELAARLQLSQFMLGKRQEMDKLFDWANLGNERLKRMFTKAADIGTSIVTDEAKQTRFGQLRSDMIRIESTATVEHPDTGEPIPLSRVVSLMASPDVSEAVKKALWSRWRDASGRPVKQMYEEYVDLANEMIRKAGYANFAKYWQSWYEPKEGQDFEQVMAELFNGLLPLYKELHGYVRHALMQKYPASIFPPTGHIPGHILGHMWGGRWDDLEPFTKPFPNEPQIDVTKVMREKNWTVRQMFEASQDFFASLGLGNMTDTFWEKSVLEKLPGVDMVCHVSAWDFYTDKGDFRIKQCTEITGHYLAVTHHEMGHIQYFQQYEKQPVVFRDGANPGFHEAIGDTIELSVMTPGHLRKLGLLESDSESDEFYLNSLFLMALKKAAYLSFGYLIDNYRYKLFKGEVPKNQWNSEWVNQRCQLMGVSSPVLRSEEDFDAGAIYHVVANVEYFLSLLLQFQFHQSLCQAAGVTENFHKCSIYGNSAAGAKLKALLESGTSLHWEEALFKISGTRQISAKPLLDYFAPLLTYIAAKNKENGVSVGWGNNCPPDDWYKSASQLGSLSACQVFALAAIACFTVRLIRH